MPTTMRIPKVGRLGSMYSMVVVVVMMMMMLRNNTRSGYAT